MINSTTSTFIAGLSRAAKRATAQLKAVASRDPIPCWEEYLRQTRD